MKAKMIIKKLSQTRKASEDMENTILFATEDNQIMALSAYPSETVFDVEIKEENE
jgi:hypothetical protein